VLLGASGACTRQVQLDAQSDAALPVAVAAAIDADDVVFFVTAAAVLLVVRLLCVVGCSHCVSVLHVHSATYLCRATSVHRTRQLSLNLLKIYVS